MKKFATTVLLWAGGILGAALGFASVIYIHENWPAVEAPAIFTFLAFGVALIIIAWRTRAPLAENLALGAGTACLCLSAFFAIVRGWQNAVYIAYFVAALAFFLGAIWYVRRSVRRLRQDAQALPIAHLSEPSEQAILADAAEPYILYPAKWKIVRVLLILLAVTAAFGIGSAWMLTLNDVRMALAVFCLAFLAALCALTCFLLIYRLVSRKPALVVTHLGLIDGASAL